MSAAAPDPAILEYIRANRGSFTRDEIVRELRLAGHEEVDIAAAWAAVAAEDPTAVVAIRPGEFQAPATAQLPVVEPEPVVGDTTPFVEPAPFVESAPFVEPAPFVGRDPAIAQYIRANQGVYTRQAVTNSLLESGHSCEDIEAAWAELAAANAVPPPVSPAVSRRRAAMNSWEFWVLALATFFGLMVLPFMLNVAFPDNGVGAIGSCVLFIGAVAGGLIMLAFEKTRNAGYGMLAGVGALFALSIVLTLVAIVLGLIVFGICVAILSQSGTTTP